MLQYANIFILSGPSGAGEDSIIEGLSTRIPIERVITTTTRPMRSGESSRNPYYFITQEAFEVAIVEHCFVEYARQYNGNFYGVTQAEIDRVAKSGRVGIWKIEYQGVLAMKKHFPMIRSILISAPSLDILEQRIRRRDPGASEVYIAERMAYTREWLKHTDVYDTIVINKEGQLEAAVEAVKTYIQTHQLQA